MPLKFFRQHVLHKLLGSVAILRLQRLQMVVLDIFFTMLLLQFIKHCSPLGLFLKTRNGVAPLPGSPRVEFRHWFQPPRCRFAGRRLSESRIMLPCFEIYRSPIFARENNMLYIECQIKLWLFFKL